ncbi:MAG: alpha/beta hydrolase [Leucobacter sp.]
MAQWRSDDLGEGFERLDLDLGEDNEGPLTATLVRALPPRRPLLDRLLRRERPLEAVDVLYVHGWSDYFFQTSLARFFTDRGARFFALDLRKYGRSLREGQTPGFITQLDDYGAEIELALAEIAEQTAAGEQRRLVLFGHSTGGLVLSLWAAAHPGRADAVILNSPWIEFQLSATARQLIAPIINLSARIHAFDVGPQFDYGYYDRAQHEVGPAEDLARVNDAWRPSRAHAVHTGWLRAILDGHARVHSGLGIEVPILTLLSQSWAAPLRWSEELTRADTVLEVDEVAAAAVRLGSNVTVERIDGALHDVFLSSLEAREEAYARLDRWLVGWQAADRIGS